MRHLEQAKIMVVGDVMLDHYYHGSANRVSPEAPVPVVVVGEEIYKLGGAANVAYNLVALGQRPILIGMLGHDDKAQHCQSMCSSEGIEFLYTTAATKPTITKTRVISQNQQLLRLDFESSFAEEDKAPLFELFKTRLDEVNVVIFSDYAKGTLSDVAQWITYAREEGKTVLVDPKGKDFSRYAGASLIKPNLKEFIQVAGDELPLDEAAKALIDQGDVEHLLVTMGSAGMRLFSPFEVPYHVDSHSSEVVDVTGAGDTVIATVGAALGSGYSWQAATTLANLAASIVVSKLGTATVSQQELQAAYAELHGVAKGVLPPEELQTIIQQLQAQGKVIVMTNGCFDLLHSGHVVYLEKAREQGDHLIVAVNDDESIRRIKGPARPISPQSSRMRVLAALASVDWVIPFSEDTPIPLLEKIRPNVLVKGADYTEDRVVGGDVVKSYGGEVRIISHEHTYISSSTLIERAKAEEHE